MGRRTSIVQHTIFEDHKITKETDYPFLYTLESGLLLALKEMGQLSQTQYRAAEEQHAKQRKVWLRKQAANHD